MVQPTVPIPGPTPDVAVVEAPRPAVTPSLWVPGRDLAERHEAWLAPIQLRRDLVDQGMTDKAIARLLRDGSLARPRWGSYVDAADFAYLDAVGRHALTSRAVLMQSAVDVSLSHSSSMVWFGAPDWGLDLSQVHVTRHDGRAGRREAGVCQHKGVLVDGDLVEVHGMSLTHPTRAGLELTTLVGLEAGLVHVNHLLHVGLTTIEALWERYESMRDWPGSLSTEPVLRLADGRLESILESRFYALCFRNSLPMPEPQYRVEDHGGILVARLDFAWPKLRKYVECDGRIKYERPFRPDESAVDVVLREKERDKLVRRLTGFDGERVTWADVENERRTVAMLRAFLGR